jgi:hypothetical protein
MVIQSRRQASGGRRQEIISTAENDYTNTPAPAKVPALELFLTPDA